jgi:pimeloyl-ACP methyl ester carboxylesterase
MFNQTTVLTTGTTTTSDDSATSRRSIWRTAAIAGVVAAVATTVIGAAAKAADVPLLVGELQVQIPAFAIFTLVGAALGGLLASQLAKRSNQPRRTFVIATAVLTALSFVPDLLADATTATKVTLVAAHVVAAAVIIPAIAARLSPTRSR